jgi:sugar phosphate isomerase/epimerase
LRRSSKQLWFPRNPVATDLHLPLGLGNIDWPWVVKALKNAGYDGRITLEVFSDDPDHLTISREKMRQWWDVTEP